MDKRTEDLLPGPKFCAAGLKVIVEDEKGVPALV